MFFFVGVGKPSKSRPGQIVKAKFYVVEGADAGDAAAVVHRIHVERGRPWEGKTTTHVTPLEGWAPPRITIPSRITGTAVEIARALEAALTEIGAVWWNAATAPPEYGREGNRTYDSYSVSFKSLELDSDHVRAVFEKHGLVARTVSPPLEGRPYEYYHREIRIERGRTTTTRKLTKRQLTAALKQSKPSFMAAPQIDRKPVKQVRGKHAIPSGPNMFDMRAVNRAAGVRE